MNTRVQVEHCVTEMTTGIDIVKEGIKAAAGEELAYRQEDVELRGHAIECRINAEDASKNFAPAPGRIGAYREPSGPGVRVDSGVEEGGEVSPMYDPMVAKLIVWDADREQATQRMLRALDEYEIEGLKTLIPFHQALLATEQWAKGETCRDLLEDKQWLKTLAFPAPDARHRRRGRGRGGGEGPADLRGRGVGQALRRARARPLPFAGAVGPHERRRKRRRRPSRPSAERERARPAAGGGRGPDTLPSPLQGNMWKVLVKQGDTVAEGQLLCIIEAMKMENEITAHKAGTIFELPISEGAPIAGGRADRDDRLSRVELDGPLLHVSEILVEELECPLAAEHAPVTGNDVLGVLHQCAQAPERVCIRLGRATRAQQRQLDRRQVVAASPARPPTGSGWRSRRRCGRTPGAEPARVRRFRSSPGRAEPGPPPGRVAARVR